MPLTVCDAEDKSAAGIRITEEVYGALFKGHFASLTTFCLRFNIAEAAAQDLVIQQFLNLWNGRTKYSFKSVNQIKTSCITVRGMPQ
jgi:DNA-directed RNA polymerase specialized sigma24 family protein